MNDVPFRSDADQLERGVAQADLRVLLMVVFHLSGDHRWLEAPYRPKRDVKLIADEDAGLPAEIQDEIRAEAVRLIGSGDRPVVDDPGDSLMVEMMSTCLGEDVPPEYAPMMREEMGFVSRMVEWNDPAQPRVPDAPLIIVGAGASGIALGANLQTLGIPYVILEKNTEVGGTWLVNRYPGCAVDTPNHAYSFSFGRPYRWQSYFSPRDQILDYLKRSATETGVRANIRFGATVRKAEWDEADHRWRVTVSEGDGKEEVLIGSALVSAIGQLSLPSVPAIPGMDDYGGPLFHSSDWPADLDVTGKHVAVIGTGASSMQIVPTIADDVASLTVYQRSPQWARPVPRYHDRIDDDAQCLLETVPLYAAWFRFTMLWRYGDGLHPFLQKDPDWPHPERSLNKVNDRHRQQMTDHIEAELRGRPDLLPKCLPSYPPYGKRILLDNGWFSTIVRDHVELVTDPIEVIEAEGVRCTDGTVRPADVIVLATGFSVEVMAARLDIRGRDGRTLAAEWADDNPTAYLGISVPGFPNFFCMQGPNTGLGHGGSAIFQSECQSRYIAACLVKMLEEGVSAIDVRQEPLDRYVEDVDAHHERMVWTHPGMSTYYRNKHGRVVSVMPWRLVDYWTQTRTADFDAYDVVHKSGP